MFTIPEIRFKQRHVCLLIIMMGSCKDKVNFKTQLVTRKKKLFFDLNLIFLAEKLEQLEGRSPCSRGQPSCLKSVRFGVKSYVNQEHK
jgi:hypothetical protein